jgi:hypothetical protein
MKYKNVGLIHAIAICIVAFNVMACSNGDNKVLQADGKESIQSSIAKVSHIAEGIEKTYEQSIQRKCMDNNRVDYSDQVLIEKVDQSVYDEQGRLIAQIYYAKPVIQGDSEAVKKINAYFDNEANAFYDQGTSVTWFSKDAFHQFKDGLELMKERWGNEILAEYPPRYAMDTSVCYMDENIISIVQVRNYMLEHNSWYCYGSTFDLRTGELIPITKLINIKPEEMKAIFLIAGNIIDIGVYEVLKDDNYVIDFYEHHIDMKYEYFYDGESYYLINDFALEFRTSSVLKWNGKLGTEFSITKLVYEADPTNGEIKCREPGMS